MSRLQTRQLILFLKELVKGVTCNLLDCTTVKVPVWYHVEVSCGAKVNIYLYQVKESEILIYNFFPS